MLEASRREFTSLEAWRSTLAEFIATLLFVFLGAGSVIVSGGLPNGDLDAARLGIIALAHGLAIAILAYATANISGGHINPAVTFAAWLTRKISAARGLMFIAAQLSGAVVGALLLLATIPAAADTNLGSHALGPDVSISMGLLMEIMVTFALVLAHSRDGHSLEEIAFLMQISPSLVRQYQALYEHYNTPVYQARINEIIRLVKARGFRPSQLEKQASEEETTESTQKKGIQP